VAVPGDRISLERPLETRQMSSEDKLWLFTHSGYYSLSRRCWAPHDSLNCVFFCNRVGHWMIPLLRRRVKMGRVLQIYYKIYKCYKVLTNDHRIHSNQSMTQKGIGHGLLQYKNLEFPFLSLGGRIKCNRFKLCGSQVVL